jgi:hypothetical protein
MNKKRVICISMVFVMFLTLFAGTLSGTNMVEAAENGLVLHLKFDEDLNDASGNSNNGTASYGRITYDNGIFGKSAVFNGKSYIEITDSDSLDLEQCTISLWIYKQNNFDGDHHVPFVYKEEDEESFFSPYTLYERGDNCPQLELHDSSDDTELNQFSLTGTPIDIRKWYLLTATFDGNEVKIYENDQLLIKETVHGVPAKTIGNLFIGMKQGYDSSDYFTGKMDDLRIYNRELSAEEVSNLYSNGLAAKPTYLTQTNKLVAHYKFNGNYKDSSDFGNDAELTAGKIQFVNGVNGKAAKFTKKAYLEVADSTSLSFDEGFTATGWLNIASDDGIIFNKTGLSASDISNDYNIRMVVLEDNFEFDYIPFGHQPGGDSISYGTDTSMKTMWVHFAITFNGKEFRWYKNGKLVHKEKADHSEGVKISHSTGSLMIGTDGERFFNGAMDELKFYNYGLSAKEVAAEYKQRDSLSISSDNQNAIKTLSPKETVTLTTTRKYMEASKSERLTSDVMYKTSNKNIFTVSKEGKITAINKGKATLTITHGGVSNSYSVFVK